MRKRKPILVSSIVLMMVIGVGVILFWARITRMAVQLRTYLAMPVYDEPITSAGNYTNIIFLHHSTGRNLIADGNVRWLLTERGYQFWDHDYNHIGLTNPDGSLINAHYRIPGMMGDGNTDVGGLAKLFSQPVLTPPDNAFSRLLQHEVIIVKSCFPNSAIKDDAMQRQFQEYYLQMRDVMDIHSDRIFIIMTSPPLHPLATNPDEAARARIIADWLTSDAFLGGHSNVFVFDYFDLLADPKENTLRTAYQITATEPQSHPNQLANETLGPLFAEFIDMAVQTFRNS